MKREDPLSNNMKFKKLNIKDKYFYIITQRKDRLEKHLNKKIRINLSLILLTSYQECDLIVQNKKYQLY